jgi:hypothetical protein
MGSVYKRGRIWWIAYYSDGVKMRESAQTEKETVARPLLKSREGVCEGPSCFSENEPGNVRGIGR